MQERAKLSAHRARTARLIPTMEQLMPLVTAKLANLRATLESDVAQGRMALGALFGEERLRIYADGRIEGAAWLDDGPSQHERPQRYHQRPLGGASSP